MIWVNVIAGIVLAFSVIGGIREGAVRQFFSLIALLVAIPVAGISYHLLAGLLSFIPGENWENFISFFIMMAAVIVALHFIFLLPSRFFQKSWKSNELLFRIIGAIFSLFNAALGMVVFTLVLYVYPIFDWLESSVSGSVILNWLVAHLSFVQAVLPEVFRQAATMV
jgi:uncharacterized membrane protein required for colicin V production